MPRIERIGIKGFRRLEDVNIEMHQMMALIGANGVGKTSFMDALSILADSAKGSMNRRINDMGGASEVITRGRSEDIALYADMGIPNYEPLKYCLCVTPQGQGYAISTETLIQSRTGYEEPFKHIESNFGDIHYYDTDKRGLVRPTWEHDTLESFLSQVPKMFQEPEEFRRTISSMTRYSPIDVGQRSPVKMPQQLRPASFPGPNGEDLGPFLYNLRESDRTKYEAIEDALRVAFPGFESLSFPIVAAGMIAPTWKDRAYRNPFYMHQLSEGTLRFLWLVALLQSTSLTTITMIDEPELSLHPEMLPLLAGLMREASQRTQIIIATHSDRLVRFLDPGEVAVMDMGEDGRTTITWADQLDLDGWLAEYSLDEVWQMGAMGGRA